MKKLIFLTAVVLSMLSSNVFAETWIPDYGYYENSNEIKAKDEIMTDVTNIFDNEASANAGGETIKNGKYYIETKYKGGYNGTDADYVYLDDIAGKDGKDGVNGLNGNNGEDGTNGIDGVRGDKGDIGEKGTTGDKGDEGKKGEQGLQGVQGKGLEDRVEGIVEIRVLDTKKTTWAIYGGHDFNNDVNIVGAKFTYKFGKSYYEKKIEELEKKLNKLED